MINKKIYRILSNISYNVAYLTDDEVQIIDDYGKCKSDKSIEITLENQQKILSSEIDDYTLIEGWDILLDETLKELIDLYEYEISYIDENLLKLYDKQLDEYRTFFSKEEVINYFTTACEYRHSIDENIFHITQAKKLRSLIK